MKVDPYGTALVLEEFGGIIARGGAGVVIASQSGRVADSLNAYQISRRGNALRVMAERVGTLPMGRDGAFITGSDFLMDGGVAAAC